MFGRTEGAVLKGQFAGVRVRAMIVGLNECARGTDRVVPRDPLGRVVEVPVVRPEELLGDVSHAPSVPARRRTTGDVSQA